MKTALIGLGNPLKQDDNIGNIIVEKLSEKIKNNSFVFIKSYLTPENYLLPLKNTSPDIIYFVDAVEFKGRVGDVKLFSLEEMISLGNVATHNIPITIYKNYFPDTKIKIIGVKVKSIDFDEQLSKDLKVKLNSVLKKVENIILQ